MIIVATVLLGSACSAVYSASDQQVIHIPSDNGIRTERMSTGRARGAVSLGRETPILVRNLFTQVSTIRAALLSSSDYLYYFGPASLALFIADERLEASIDPRSEFSTVRNVCETWSAHVKQIVDTGDLVACSDYTYAALNSHEGEWQGLSAEIHSISYSFPIIPLTHVLGGIADFRHAAPYSL